MSKIKITVPATTANLGPGFDCLGLALKLYNSFVFEKSDTFSYENFDERYANENNLVTKSAKYTYQSKKHPIQCFKVRIDEHVPPCRGLGSSATCVIAGVLAANYFMGNILTDEEILHLATDIEGHPDNVAPAINGGLVASVNDKEIIAIKYDVAPSLKFIAVIPNFTLATKQSRSVLPKKLDYSKIVFNMSRAINIPYALYKGDTSLLYRLLNDKMHEPYRIDLIEEGYKFKNLSISLEIPFCISGSGSTLLFITDKTDELLLELNKMTLTNEWKFIPLEVDKEGVKTEVIVDEK